MELILAGIAIRLRREHNEHAWHAWHTAYLGAYAPEKSREFIRLEKLMLHAPADEVQKTSDWRQEFDAFAAWAVSFKGNKS